MLQSRFTIYKHGGWPKGISSRRARIALLMIIILVIMNIIIIYIVIMNINIIYIVIININ